MRRFISLFLILFFLCAIIQGAAVSEELQIYSLSAANQFINIWNDYYSQNNLNLNGGYSLNEANDSIQQYWIVYNAGNMEVHYESGLIPARANIFAIYNIENNSYNICVFSDEMKMQCLNSM